MESFLSIQHSFIASVATPPLSTLSESIFKLVWFFWAFTTAYSSVVIPTYLAILQQNSKSHRNIDKKKEKIRGGVIAYWEREYGCLKSTLDNVLVEDLRVFCKENQIENDRFARTKTLFYIATAILFIGSSVLTASNDFFQKSSVLLILSLAALIAIVLILQIFTFAFTIYANYYSYRYYKKLESWISRANLPTGKHGEVLRFNAKDAVLSGMSILYEKAETKESISCWNKKEDYITWKFPNPQRATYTVIVEQSCEGDGGEYAIFLGSTRLNGKVKSTGSWQLFERCFIGKFEINYSDKFELIIKPVHIPGGGLMNLRSVSLHRVY
jgi:hypothetical protein